MGEGRGQKGNNEGVWRDAAEASGMCQSILSPLLLLGESRRGDKKGKEERGRVKMVGKKKLIMNMEFIIVEDKKDVCCVQEFIRWKL